MPIIIIDFTPNMVPMAILLGITGPGYLCALLYSGTFKRFEPEEEDINADAWSVNLDKEVQIKGVD